MEKRKVYKILFLCTGNSPDRFYEVVGKPVGVRISGDSIPLSRLNSTPWDFLRGITVSGYNE
jgi:hypothetical protein